jgi:hypothetical protein
MARSSHSECHRSTCAVKINAVPRRGTSTARGTVRRLSIRSMMAVEGTAHCGLRWAYAPMRPKAAVGPKATMTARMCRDSQNVNQDHMAAAPPVRGLPGTFSVPTHRIKDRRPWP